ncbi:hypothetical protein N0V90_000517 [Kalmusia sp. IMI 367209]|nr:hypothetical protein N0V90_000517 [Kalmusia sp. IMI 367209]
MATLPDSSQLIPMTDDEFDYIVTHISMIHIEAFKPTIAVLVAIALACFIGRISIRVVTRRKLYLDDYLLCLAVASLCAQTAMIYVYCFIWFLMNAAQQKPELAMTVPFQKYAEALYDTPKKRNSYAVLTWVTVFGVKFCFFAFFKPLIRHLRGMTIWYWFCVGFTAIALGVNCSEGFVFDKYLNAHHNVIFNDWYDLSLAYTIAVSIADVVTDMMGMLAPFQELNNSANAGIVISIPLLLLRKSRMKQKTKLSIGFFLCLSIFMIACAIARASGYIHRGSRIPDTLWRVFWQEVEGCIAVMMASITVFRTLFVSENQESINQRATLEQRPSFFTRMLPAFLSRKRSSARGSESDISLQKNDKHVELPALPSATMTGIRSFIRRHNRSQAVSTTAESELDPLEVDYHAALRTHH